MVGMTTRARVMESAGIADGSGGVRTCCAVRPTDTRPCRSVRSRVGSGGLTRHFRLRAIPRAATPAWAPLTSRAAAVFDAKFRN